jgi:hypothetical protein
MPRPPMKEVHARGGHLKVRSQKCPDCKAERDAQWQKPRKKLSPALNARAPEVGPR